MGRGGTLKAYGVDSARKPVIEIAITGGGSGLADEILETLASVEADFRLRLVDGFSAAGEARRFKGRTLAIELSEEADLATADLVIDLDATYEGTADRFRPLPPLVSLWSRVIPASLEGSITQVLGVVREPAVAVSGGVDALAAQVTQLFNGRDPEEAPFGGQLAFNSRALDADETVRALAELPTLAGTLISLERWQSDHFYTLTFSGWLQVQDPSMLLQLHKNDLVPGYAVAPNTGRMEVDEPVRVSAELTESGWVHLTLTADLERTLWSQDAKDAVMRRVLC